MIEKIHPTAAGCWIEGSRGRYASSRLLEIAKSYGFPVSDDDQSIVAAYDSDEISSLELSTGETITYDEIPEIVTGQNGLVDQAEGWMNLNLAPDGYSFGWRDGEFFLWPDTDWQEN